MTLMSFQETDQEANDHSLANNDTGTESSEEFEELKKMMSLTNLTNLTNLKRWKILTNIGLLLTKWPES